MSALRRRRLVLSGGGGNVPAWLPAGALAFADFTSGHYYAGGTVVTDPATLFGADATYDTSFSVANIGPDGLAGDLPSFLGSFLNAVIAEGGSTVVLEMYGATLCHGGIDCVDGLDYNVELIIITWDESGVGSYLYNNVSFKDLPGNKTQSGQINKVAMSFSATALALSANGQSVDTDTVAAGPWAQVRSAYIIGQYDFLRTVTVYPLKPDADLPALSTV